MFQALSVICWRLIVLSVTAAVYGQYLVNTQTSHRQPNTHGNLNFALQALCREGWSIRTIKDLSEKETTVCLKINKQIQTWREAQATCRKDGGFLLKLHYKSKINGDDLLSSFIADGITKVWTGAHSENGYLVWDDLTPHQVRQRDSANEHSAIPAMSWRWERTIAKRFTQYCGQMNLDASDDNDRRRRKRFSDDDNSDNAFNIFSRRRKSLQNGFINTNQEVPPASQTFLPNTVMSSNQQQLQDANIGIQSEHQIPGLGLSEDNVQHGGLTFSTDNQERLINVDRDSDTSSLHSNLETNHVNQVNIESFKGNNDSSSIQMDFLSSVTNTTVSIAANASIALPTSTTNAVESLNALLQSNANTINSVKHISKTFNTPITAADNNKLAMSTQSTTSLSVDSTSRKYPDIFAPANVPNDLNEQTVGIHNIINDGFVPSNSGLVSINQSQSENVSIDRQDKERNMADENKLLFRNDARISKSIFQSVDNKTVKVQEELLSQGGLVGNPGFISHTPTANKKLNARELGTTISSETKEQNGYSDMQQNENLNSVFSELQDEDNQKFTSDFATFVPMSDEQLKEGTHLGKDERANMPGINATAESTSKTLPETNLKVKQKLTTPNYMKSFASYYANNINRKFETSLGITRDPHADIESDEHNNTDTSDDDDDITFPNMDSFNDSHDHFKQYQNTKLSTIPKVNKTDLYDDTYKKNFTNSSALPEKMLHVVDNTGNKMQVEKQQDIQRDVINKLLKTLNGSLNANVEEFNIISHVNNDVKNTVTEKINDVIKHSNNEDDDIRDVDNTATLDTNIKRDEKTLKNKIDKHNILNRNNTDVFKIFRNDTVPSDAINRTNDVAHGDNSQNRNKGASGLNLNDSENNVNDNDIETDNESQNEHEKTDIGKEKNNFDNETNDKISSDDRDNDKDKNEETKTKHDDQEPSAEDVIVEDLQEQENKTIDDLSNENGEDNIKDSLNIADVEEYDELSRRINDNVMVLSSCESKLPSLCFSYGLEVISKVSTCEDGWYGHIFIDTCYKIVVQKFSYSESVEQCNLLKGRLLFNASEFERQFVFLAVQKDGQLHRDATFWYDSQADKNNCSFVSETGIYSMSSCNTTMNAVCVKDAKSLSVHTVNNSSFEDVNQDDTSAAGEARIFSSQKQDNNLTCDLISGASEFPVLWLKDGVLIETNTTHGSSDSSLYLNDVLVSTISKATGRNLSMAALQGRYWCEVWDRRTLTRAKSKPYDVRYSDVISYHSSMELQGFSLKDEVLFNMANEKFALLTETEKDIEKLFVDILPQIQNHVPDVIDVFTFVDKVRPNPEAIEYHIYFTFNRDYNTTDEDVVYNSLKTILRTQIGNKNYMTQLPGRTPIDVFRTMSLQSTVSCPAADLQTNKDSQGRVIPATVASFPKSLLKMSANSLNVCSANNPLPMGTARCMGDFYTGAYWADVVANECTEAEINGEWNKIIGGSPFTKILIDIANTTVDAKNVENVVSQVALISQVASHFTSTDIIKIADVLDLSTKVKNLPRKVGKDLVTTVDRLMAVAEKETRAANAKCNAANRIIKSLERYADNADLAKQDRIRFVSDNMVVEIWDINPASQTVIGLAAENKGEVKDMPFKTENIATVYENARSLEAQVDAAIELPKEVFARKEKGESISNRLSMMLFRKSQLFEASINEGGPKVIQADEQFANLNSYIISARISGRQVNGLQEKIKIIFKPIKNHNGARSCVWWDFSMYNSTGGWSTEGCLYDGKINGREICLCDHLTNFAVLIDLYGQANPIPEKEELSLSLISLLGLSCSILGLSLTIVSYVFFKKLRQGRAQLTLFNLSLALLLSMLTFLVGIKQTHNYLGCIVVAILLHYLILVSFMWMLMEAVLQYLTFVKILGTYITRFTLKTVLPAWGMPLVPVISVLSVDYTLYKGGPNYCWMDLPAFYYAFVIPVTCIIIVNMTIFFITIVSIFRRGKGLRSNQKKHKIALTNLQAAVTSFILLGLTWVFGYLAISDARLPFMYIFTILNSFQGFFIFVLFVLRKKKVREQWHYVCCTGNEKDNVSRSLSANSIPSTYSNGSKRDGRKERNRSDSTKTLQSTYSNSSSSFTNYGYDPGYGSAFPFNRYNQKAFRKF